MGCANKLLLVFFWVRGSSLAPPLSRVFGKLISLKGREGRGFCRRRGLRAASSIGGLWARLRWCVRNCGSVKTLPLRLLSPLEGERLGERGLAESYSVADRRESKNWRQLKLENTL